MRLTSSVAGKSPMIHPAIFGTTALCYDHLVDRKSLDLLVLDPTITAISQLACREEDWDGRGSAKPNSSAVQRAMTLVHGFYKFADAAGKVNGHSWAQPHVSTSEDGEVVMEWWKNTHKLTIYIGPETAEYFKVWGANISNEMSDGPLIGDQFQGLWLWLNA